MEACLGSSLGGAALLRQATWLPAVHAGMGGSRRSAAGRCPLVVCQAQLVDFSPSRYNAQWRQRQHRRLLLLQAHEAAAAAQPSAGATPATPLDALASTIQLHSPPSSQLEALLAQLPGGRPAQAQQKPRRARASKAQRPDHGTSASSSSSTGGSAENEGWLPGDRARRVPPQLSNP